MSKTISFILLISIVSLRSSAQIPDHYYDDLVRSGDITAGWGDTNYEFKATLFSRCMRRAEAVKVDHFIIRNSVDKMAYVFRWAIAGDTFKVSCIGRPDNIYVKQTGWRILHSDYSAVWVYTKQKNWVVKKGGWIDPGETLNPGPY